MQVALLAERIRVEERMLKEAFAERGYTAELVAPSSLTVDLNDDQAIAAPLALNRSPVTIEQSTMAALLAANGTTVINRAATARLLADRLALLRHLIIAGIPTPHSLVTFGEEATLNAIESVEYPAVLKSLNVDPHFPIAFVEDRDSAEALVEHRVMLGEERSTLVQQFIAPAANQPAGTVRIAVVGDEPIAFEIREHDSWRPVTTTAFGLIEEPGQSLFDLGKRVIDRLGTGVYGIDVIQASAGPVVIGVENLLQFRALPEQGIDIAGKIADFAISQKN